LTGANGNFWRCDCAEQATSRLMTQFTHTLVVGTVLMTSCLGGSTLCYCTQVQAEVEAAAVNQHVVGITFTTGTVSAVLPLLPEDQDLLPPPYEMHVLQQPQKRAKRRTLNNFRVLTLRSPPAPTDSSQAATDAAVPALKLDAAAASTATSAPSSRPVSSRGTDHAQTAAHPAVPAPAAAPAPAALIRAASKMTPRGKSSHASAHASRPPSVLEEASPEAPGADK
jgi:hypothetical protein